MAQRVVRIDDLDQKTEGATAEVFTLFDVTYDIDLGEANRTLLRETMAPFMEAARARPKTPAAKKTTIDKIQLDAIRRWAHQHGYEFSDRGRIPHHIVEAYDKLAHPSAREKTEAKVAGDGSRGLFSSTTQ